VPRVGTVGGGFLRVLDEDELDDEEDEEGEEDEDADVDDELDDDFGGFFVVMGVGAAPVSVVIRFGGVTGSVAGRVACGAARGSGGGVMNDAGTPCPSPRVASATTRSGTTSTAVATAAIIQRLRFQIFVCGAAATGPEPTSGAS
jgi:hypothetical protein